MLPLGLSVRLTRLRFRYGGSVTWAAKTECERIPKPRENFTRADVTSALALGYLHRLITHSPQEKFPPFLFSAHNDWTPRRFIR